MNVTQKVVKKKQKKGSGAGRFITKSVKTDSFLYGLLSQNILIS